MKFDINLILSYFNVEYTTVAQNLTIRTSDNCRNSYISRPSQSQFLLTWQIICKPSFQTTSTFGNEPCISTFVCQYTPKKVIQRFFGWYMVFGRSKSLLLYLLGSIKKFSASKGSWQQKGLLIKYETSVYCVYNFLWHWI